MANSIDRIPKELVSRTEMLEADTPITRVLAVVQKNNAALISKDGAYYGVVDMRSLSRGKGMHMNKNAIALNYAIRVPKIFPTTTIDDAIFYFYNSKATALPYFEENKPIGIVSRYTLLKMLLSIDSLSGIKCSDIMTTPVLGIDANANLAQANSVMSDRNIGRLIVIENGKLSGIITKHDISANYTVTKERAPEMKSKLYSPSNIVVRNIMEKSPVTIGASDEVREAIRKLVTSHISSIVVVKGDKPVGILTISDVLAAIISRKKNVENKIIIAGLDRSTYEYEYEIKEQARLFLEKVEKFRKVKIDYITIRVKKIKGRQYEINARAGLGSLGSLNVRHVDFDLDRTFMSVLEKLEEQIKKRKDLLNKKKYEYMEYEQSE